MRITVLTVGQQVTVGRTTLVYQRDGNLVLYRGGAPIWASMAFASDPGVCQMQDDGNVVCYDSEHRPYWATNTHGWPGAVWTLQDDGNLVIYASDGRPIWATNTVDREHPDATRWRIYGNFLANGVEPWSFMLPGWPPARRDHFVREYRRLGYRHLPIGIWGSYRDEPRFDYRDQPETYASLLRALRDEGLVPIVMIDTDEFDGRWVSADDRILRAARYLDRLARLLRPEEYEWCLGWEINQVAGWHEAQNPRQGHDLIRLATVVTSSLGRAAWLHLQPNWWAPHYADGDEAQWWQDVGTDCLGLLAQIRPDASIEVAGDPSAPDGLYLLLEYPRATDGARGIAGRLAAARKQCVLFEHSRTYARWARVRDRVAPYPAISGIC